MAWIHYFHMDDNVPGKPIEFIVLSEEVGPDEAQEEWGEEGYNLDTIVIEEVSGMLSRLPTDRALYQR